MISSCLEGYLSLLNFGGAVASAEPEVCRNHSERRGARVFVFSGLALKCFMLRDDLKCAGKSVTRSLSTCGRNFKTG